MVHNIQICRRIDGLHELIRWKLVIHGGVMYVIVQRNYPLPTVCMSKGQ